MFFSETCNQSGVLRVFCEGWEATALDTHLNVSQIPHKKC
jgi:hypothetical protein